MTYLYHRWGWMGTLLLLLACLPSKPIYAQCDYINDITGITLSVQPAGDAANPALYTQVYVLVNHLGRIHATGSTPNFTGVPAGNYFLYAVNYSNGESGAVVPLLAVGQDWANLQAYGDNPIYCLNYVGPYSGCAISVCDEMDVCDDQLLNETATGFAASGYTQAYCIVCAGTVQAVNTTGSFDLSTIPAVAPGANCQLFAINYQTAGGNPVTVGAAWTAVESTYCAGATCFAYMGMDLNIGNTTVAVTSVTNVSCSGGNNGAINITPGGSPTPYSFSWSNGATTEDATGLAAGSYTVTVTNAIGCVVTATATVTQPTAITVTVNNTTATTCGQTNGAADISVSGGTPGYTYQWSNSAATQDLSGVASGTYTVTVTDANLCTATASVTINNTSGLSGSSVVTNVSCNGGNNGAINITASGGTAPYTYNWGGGITTEDRTGLIAGTYNVTITDATACPFPIAGIVVSQPTAITATTAVTNVNCNGSNNGAIDLSVSGGTTAYSFNWGGGITTEDRTGLIAGTYTVTVTDANFCTATASGTVTEPTALSIAAPAVTNVSCNGGNDGAIDLTVSGGTTAYSFDWGAGVTTEDRTGLSIGTYTVTVTDANGCTTTASATITEPAAMTLTTLAVDASCNAAADGCAAVNVTGGTGDFGYAWSGSALNLDSICGLAAGTYTVTVTDTIVSGSAGGMLLDTAYIETFNGAHGWTLNVPTGTNGADNNYWEVDDDEGGVAVGGCGVGNNGDPTLHITSVFFPGGGAAYDAGGLCGILFCPETNMRAESPAFSTIGMASPTLRFNYISNGQALLDNASVWYNSGAGWTLLTASIKSTLCGGGQGQWTLYNVQLPASCANNANVRVGINWTNNDDGVGTDPSVAINNVMVVDSTMGSASPSVVCSATATVTINEPTALTLSVDNVTDANCNGANDGAVAITAGGGVPAYTFAWSDNSTNEDLSNATAGNYTVTMTDANGCTTTATATIAEPTLLTVNVDGVTDASCTGSADGSMDITVTGGVPAYTFVWSDNSTNEDLTGVNAGVYTVTVTDANGCTTTDGALIGEAVTLNVTIASSVDPTCNGNADGSITAAGTGGTPAYTFSWSNSAAGATVSNIGGGTYSVTMTDANGCADTASITLVDPAAVVVDMDTITPMTGCGGVNDGQLAALASGGTGAFAYLWSNTATTAAIGSLAAGTYTVTVTDANGCSVSGSATITAPFTPAVSPFIINPGVTDTIVTWGDVIAINGGNDQSSQGVTYVWTPVGTVPGAVNFADSLAHSTTIQPSVDGVYTLQITATSADGCVATATVIIDVKAGSFWGMPSAFTPNGDGQNDRVKPVKLDPEFIQEFKIYNRYGEKVYDNRELSDGGWDGEFRGQPQARDAYMYVLVFQLPGDAEPTTMRGEVILLR